MRELMDEKHFETKEQAIDDGKRIAKKMQRSRQIRKGRRRKNAARTFLCLLMNILLILALVYLTRIPQWYIDKSAFLTSNSGTLEILNNNIVSTKKILAALKTEEVPEVPIYMAKTDKLKAKLMQFPPVEEVYIRRYAFPARLQIILRESEPYITISPDAKVQPIAFFTRTGKLIGREYLPLKPEFKTLLVLSYGNKGDDYTKWDLKKLQKLEKIAKYIEVYSNEQVEYIDLRNPDDAFVKIKSVNIRLGRIDEHVGDRIERIPSILPKVRLMDTKIEYLDLRWQDPVLKLDK